MLSSNFTGSHFWHQCNNAGLQVSFCNIYCLLHSSGVHVDIHRQTDSKTHSHTLTRLLFSHSSNHSQVHSFIIQSHSCIPNTQSLNQSDLLHALATLSATHIHALHTHTTHDQSQRETRNSVCTHRGRRGKPHAWPPAWRLQAGTTRATNTQK